MNEKGRATFRGETRPGLVDRFRDSQAIIMSTCKIEGEAQG